MDDKFRGKKREEGLQLMKSAEKHLQTSLLKFKTTPDYDSACMDYDKAAISFKTAQDYENCIAASLKAAECFKQTGEEYRSAKMYEQAGYMYKELKNYPKCGEMIQLAADKFMSSGQVDSAATCLDKCAKSFDQSPQADDALKLLAVELLKRSFQVGQASERVKEAIQSLDYAAKILLNVKKYEASLELTNRSLAAYQEINSTSMIFRCGLHSALLNLQLGNTDGAEAAASIVGVVDDELCMQLVQLINAYNAGDQDTVSKIVLGQNFVYTENEFAKLGKNLKVPEDKRQHFLEHGKKGDSNFTEEPKDNKPSNARVSIDSDEDLR